MAKLIGACCAIALVLSVPIGASAQVDATDSGYCSGSGKKVAHMKDCQPAAAANAGANANAQVTPGRERTPAGNPKIKRDYRTR